MRVVFLTGDHRRHAYMARCIDAAGMLKALVIEKREPALPVIRTSGRSDIDRLTAMHFERRADAERRAFGGAVMPEVPTLHISRDELNSSRTADFISRHSPDIVLSYGVHKLSSSLLDAMPTKRRWNIHGGLSPRYRGAITHFWPSYMLEPQMTGMTVHELTPALDGGAIVHQSIAELARGDGLHDLACRAVMSLGSEIGSLLALAKVKDIRPVPQKSSGKLWLAADWRPEHLRSIYDLYGDRIVDRYLDGEFKRRDPELIRQELS